MKKKLYIALFALIFGLIPTYSSACEWLCSCSCGNRNQIQPTPAPAQTATVAPVAQAMDPSAANQPAPATRTVRRPAPSLKLTEAQKHALRLVKSPPSSAARPVHIIRQLPMIPEGRPTLVAPVPLAFAKRHPLQEDHKRLLNAIRLRQHEKALEILKTNISEEELNARSSKTRKTPILYALQQAVSKPEDPASEIYWDIVADLIARVDIQLPLPSEIRDAVPADKQIECLRRYASLTMPY